MDANGAEHGVRGSRRAVYVKPVRDQPVYYVLNLGVCSALLHHDDHRSLDFLASNLKNIWPFELSAFRKHRNLGQVFFPSWCPCDSSPSGCMAWRSAARASSMMRSKRRRMAASVSGP